MRWGMVGGALVELVGGLEAGRGPEPVAGAVVGRSLCGVPLWGGRFDLGPLDLPLDRAKRQCPKALPDLQF